MSFLPGGESGSISVKNNNAFSVKVYDGDTLLGDLNAGAANIWTFTSWKITVEYGTCVYCYSTTDPYDQISCTSTTTTTTTCPPVESFTVINKDGFPTVSINNTGATSIEIKDGMTLVDTIGGTATGIYDATTFSSGVLTIKNGDCTYCFDATDPGFTQIPCV